jgi:hypothetical protein
MNLRGAIIGGIIGLVLGIILSLFIPGLIYPLDPGGRQMCGSFIIIVCALGFA